MQLTATLLFARLWRQHPRESFVLGTLGVAAAMALAGSAYSTPSLPDNLRASAAQGETALPAPPPLIVRQLPAQDALSVNAAIPLSTGPNPAARPFKLAAADAASKARALDCLTSAIYYEAGQESIEGQRAVAQVVLNRVRHPAFPASICAVVFEGSTRATGCQFTFTCDGSLARRPVAGLWTRARKVAESALAGSVYAPVGYATHYHANYVVPYWAPTLAKSAVVGAHIFYRWAGGWGRPPAFGQRYAGRELDSAALRLAALDAEAKRDATDAIVTAEEAVAILPGATLVSKDDRTAVRFNLARQAVEDATRSKYVEKFEASDNLRWSLSKDVVKKSEKPLGRPDPVIEPTSVGSGAGALK